jgi:hypothetical protein
MLRDRAIVTSAPTVRTVSSFPCYKNPRSSQSPSKSLYFRTRSGYSRCCSFFLWSSHYEWCGLSDDDQPDRDLSSSWGRSSTTHRTSLLTPLTSSVPVVCSPSSPRLNEGWLHSHLAASRSADHFSYRSFVLGLQSSLSYGAY